MQHLRRNREAAAPGHSGGQGAFGRRPRPCLPGAVVKFDESPHWVECREPALRLRRSDERVPRGVGRTRPHGRIDRNDVLAGHAVAITMASEIVIPPRLGTWVRPEEVEGELLGVLDDQRWAGSDPPDLDRRAQPAVLPPSLDRWFVAAKHLRRRPRPKSEGGRREPLSALGHLGFGPLVELRDPAVHLK